jgi:hypothetical protein
METVTIPVVVLASCAEFYLAKEAEYREMGWTGMAEWAQGKASVYSGLLSDYAKTTV